MTDQPTNQPPQRANDISPQSTAPRQTQAKALVAALLALAVTVADSLVQAQDVTWRTVVVAVIAALAAHQGVFWTSNEPRGKHRP